MGRTAKDTEASLMPSLPPGLQDGSSWLQDPHQICSDRETPRALSGSAFSQEGGFVLNFTEIIDILGHSAQLSNLHGCLPCLPM